MFGDEGTVELTFCGDAIDADEKVASAAVTAIRQVASDSGRPIEVAAAMADRKLKIYSATERNTGITAFLTAKEIPNPVNAARFEIGEAVPESGDDRFLTVSGLRAKQLMLCDETFESESNMLQSLSGVEPGRIKVTTTDHWVYVLNRPWLTTLILIVGIICLYFEMTAPGATLPGLVSLLCFGLFFWSHVLGGTATGLEIMLFLLGTLALFIEIFVLPGFGVFGISGMIMVALALLMATQDFVIPDNPQQWKQLEGNGLSILLACIVVAIIIVVQVFWLDSIPGLSRLQLRPEEMTVVAAATSLHSAAHLQLGVRGICQSDLRPSGKILVEGQLIDVLSEGEYVEAGQAVSVIRIEGNCITVRKVTG